MAAVPSRFVSDEPPVTDPEAGAGGGAERLSSSPPPNPSWPEAELPGASRQLTVRALVVGCAIGAVLAAGNVYIGLKSSFIDGGALTAALLSFAFFATFKRLARMPFGPFENNVAQTAAASAAIMAFVHGLMGPIPAMMLMGHHQPAWALWLWGITLALIGLVIGVVLRRKLVVDDALPFPTGTATAELIRTVHANQGSAARRTRLLIVAALAAAVLTWFRDGRPALLPQALYLPITVGGLSGASLTLGIATSPLMAATGIFIGLRVALSLLVGGVIAWGIIGPWGVGAGWIADGNYATLASWLVWPAVGMMLASTIVPFRAQLARGRRGIGPHAARRAQAVGRNRARRLPRDTNPACADRRCCRFRAGRGGTGLDRMARIRTESAADRRRAFVVRVAGRGLRTRCRRNRHRAGRAIRNDRAAPVRRRWSRGLADVGRHRRRQRFGNRASDVGVQGRAQPARVGPCPDRRAGGGSRGGQPGRGSRLPVDRARLPTRKRANAGGGRACPGRRRPRP